MLGGINLSRGSIGRRRNRRCAPGLVHEGSTPSPGTQTAQTACRRETFKSVVHNDSILCQRVLVISPEQFRNADLGKRLPRTSGNLCRLIPDRTTPISLTFPGKPLSVKSSASTQSVVMLSWTPEMAAFGLRHPILHPTPLATSPPALSGITVVSVRCDAGHCCWGKASPRANQCPVRRPSAPGACWGRPATGSTSFPLRCLRCVHRPEGHVRSGPHTCPLSRSGWALPAKLNRVNKVATGSPWRGCRSVALLMRIAAGGYGTYRMRAPL